MVFDYSFSMNCECGGNTQYPRITETSKLLDSSKYQGKGSANHWLRVLLEYRTLDLTFQFEQLVALSGSGQRIFYKAGRCAAGMSREDILNYLLWSRNDYSKTTVNRRSSTYIAPSRSWASIKGDIKDAPEDEEDDPDLDNPVPELESGGWLTGIKTVHCVPVGKDHFGALKESSYLRILARTILVQLRKVKEELVLLHVKSDKLNVPASINTTVSILDVDISESAGEDHMPDASILMMVYLR